MAETAEEMARKPEIRKELQRATGEKRPEKVKAAGRDKFWVILHIIVLAMCIAAYLAVGYKLIRMPQSTVGLVARILRGTTIIVIVLAVAPAISVYALGRVGEPSFRFTLPRVLHLVVALAIAAVVISIIF